MLSFIELLASCFVECIRQSRALGGPVAEAKTGCYTGNPVFGTVLTASPPRGVSNRVCMRGCMPSR